MGVAVKLRFKDFEIDAVLYETETARRFAEGLPYNVQLTQWGREFYGPINKDLGSEHPVSVIPAGGLAYTNRGNYICVFFGQSPAWPVEHIGQISGDNWKNFSRRRDLTR